MSFPGFSHCRCNLHLAFACFCLFQRCILIVLILPFCHFHFLFNVDFFSEALLVLFTMKIARGHVHNSWGKSPAPGPK